MTLSQKILEKNGQTIIREIVKGKKCKCRYVRYRRVKK